MFWKNRNGSRYASVSTSTEMCALESLEGRQLMAADVGVSNGVLRVDGSDSADQILVEAVNRWVTKGGLTTFLQQYHVRVTDSAGNVRTAPDGSALNRYFNRDGITRVDVYAAGGSDTVNAGATSVNVRVFAGTGNDVITTGGGNDSVYGETGDDRASLGAGNDTFGGGMDDDDATGGAGDDYLVGGDGDDRLFGNAGTDSLDGGANADWLEAGSAAEWAIGGSREEGEFDFNAHLWAVGGTDRADVDQGKAHTCSLMSTLAAASYQGIDLTSNIRYDGDAHYSVRMFNTAINQWVWIGVNFDGTVLKNDSGKNVDPDLPTTSAQGTSEFWTLLYQRAYLSYFQGKDVTSVESVMSFTSDNDCARTMRNVLGVSTSTELMPWFAEDLKAKLDNGQVVNAGGTGHRYSVLEVFQDANGAWKVKLFNPRAYDGTHNDMPIEASGASDGVFYMTWSDFTNSAYFTNYTFSR